MYIAALALMALLSPASLGEAKQVEEPRPRLEEAAPEPARETPGEIQRATKEALDDLSLVEIGPLTPEEPEESAPPQRPLGAISDDPREGSVFCRDPFCAPPVDRFNN
jgi:hypothetical protein